jgi:hypothetical protein
MDTDTLVDKQIIDGEKLIQQLSQDGFAVTAAFWLKVGEDGRWRFYIVSPVVETEGLAQAYRQLHPLIRRMPQPFWIDPLEVKLIGPTNSIAQDVLAAHNRTPGPKACPIRYGGNKLGNVSVEGAYLYALPAGAPT